MITLRSLIAHSTKHKSLKKVELICPRKSFRCFVQNHGHLPIPSCLMFYTPCSCLSSFTFFLLCICTLSLGFHIIHVYMVKSKTLGMWFLHLHIVYHLYVFFLICSFYSFLKYELTLVASDSLNENETRVIIHVKDVNDLPPTFDQPAYSATMKEEFSDPLPHRLLQVKWLWNFSSKFKLFLRA